MGVLKWVDWTVSEPRYFQLQTDHTPVHLALLDEVGDGEPYTAHSGMLTKGKRFDHGLMHRNHSSCP